MALRQRDHWTLILVMAVLLVIFICVAAGKFASTPETAKLILNVGEEVQIPVTRLLQHPLSLSIQFSRVPGSKPIELGEWTSRRGVGYLDFDRPGAPLKVLVSGLDQEAIFEALPPYGATWRDGTITRQFVVFQEDGNPKRFPWPFNAARPTLPMGSSIVKVKILEVTADLAGEHVTMVANAPIDSTVSQPNYQYLALVTLLWPLFAFPLFIYALVLAFIVEKPKTQPEKSSDHL